MPVEQGVRMPGWYGLLLCILALVLVPCFPVIFRFLAKRLEKQRDKYQSIKNPYLRGYLVWSVKFGAYFYGVWLATLVFVLFVGGLSVCLREFR